MARTLTNSTAVFVAVSAPYPTRSLVLCSLVAFLTTCHAFDAFFPHPPVSVILSDHQADQRPKRDAPMPRLRDFDGDLDFLTSLELQHGLLQVAPNHTYPKYMLDLYSSLETGEDLVHPSADERVAIVDSDTVRSFKATVIESNSTSRVNFTGQWVAKFRVTSVSELEERVRLAELRIRLNRPWYDFTLEVALHHWVPAPCPRDPNLLECFEKQLLMSRMLPTHRHDDYDGGEVFDVTEGLRHWFTETPLWRGEYELEIHTVYSVGNREDLIDTDTVVDDLSYSSSFSSSSSSSSSLDEDSSQADTDEPPRTSSALDDVILVVFSRAIQPINIIQDAESSVKVRTPRTASAPPHKHTKRKKTHTANAVAEQQRLIQEKLLRELFAGKQESGACKRVQMDVNFYHNGWARWIMYPKSFNAYRCAGRCTGALGSKDNPSNHAIMQNMVRVGRPERAPEPCCIPTKLSPMSMIYFEHGNIVMRHHEDMIVEECGCR